MQTDFKIRNEKEVNSFLKSLPRGSLKTALQAMAEYFIGNESRGLRHSEPYKYVTRKRAYGVSFFSEKQRKYVMARIRSGEITPGQPQRTGASAAAWTMKETRGGYGYTLQNPTPGAYFTRSDKGQARQPALVGWRKVSKVVQDNMKGAVRHAVAKVREWIKQNKPKG